MDTTTCKTCSAIYNCTAKNCPKCSTKNPLEPETLIIKRPKQKTILITAAIISITFISIVTGVRYSESVTIQKIASSQEKALLQEAVNKKAACLADINCVSPQVESIAKPACLRSLSNLDSTYKADDDFATNRRWNNNTLKTEITYSGHGHFQNSLLEQEAKDYQCVFNIALKKISDASLVDIPQKTTPNPDQNSTSTEDTISPIQKERDFKNKIIDRITTQIENSTLFPDNSADDSIDVVISVNPDGSVKAVRQLTSSKNPDFDNAVRIGIMRASPLVLAPGSSMASKMEDINVTIKQPHKMTTQNH
jgi:hypothetical protein